MIPERAKIHDVIPMIAPSLLFGVSFHVKAEAKECSQSAVSQSQKEGAWNLGKPRQLEHTQGKK